jgi:hypothetical protein
MHSIHWETNWMLPDGFQAASGVCLAGGQPGLVSTCGEMVRRSGERPAIGNGFPGSARCLLATSAELRGAAETLREPSADIELLQP